VDGVFGHVRCAPIVVQFLFSGLRIRVRVQGTQGEAIAESPAHELTMQSASLTSLAFHGHRRILIRRSSLLFYIRATSEFGLKGIDYKLFHSLWKMEVRQELRS